jgi:uncharacterized LabA/DUF88 family protein
MGTAWFVDGAYALKAWGRVSAREERLDYSLLRAEIEDDAGEQIGDAYYFSCDNDPPSAAQSAFHRYLASPAPKGAGLRVKLYWLQSHALHWPKRMGGEPVVHPDTEEAFVQKTQKGVDVGLAFHLMRSYSKRGWKKLYLVGGDGDFHEVIQHLVENEDVHVTLIGTADSISGQLAPYADNVVDFAEIKDKVLRSVGGPPPPPDLDPDLDADESAAE